MQKLALRTEEKGRDKLSKRILEEKGHEQEHINDYR